MYDWLHIANFLRNFDDMAMIGQIDGPAIPTDLFHQAARSTCAIIVERLEHVVAEK